MTLSAKCFSYRERERDLFIPIQLATLSSVGSLLAFATRTRLTNSDITILLTFMHLRDKDLVTVVFLLPEEIYIYKKIIKSVRERGLNGSPPAH